MQRTAAVTGATGFVGRAVVRELLDHGWAVRALVRDEAKAKKVLSESDRLTFVRGDVLDDASLDRLMQGVTDSVHLVGIIREAGGQQTFENMHHQATRRVVAAAERASGGTPLRHVQMSALGVGDGSTIPYQATKRLGEKAVEASGLRWTIFRPGLIHGPEGEFTNMAADWVRGKAAPFVFIPYFVPGWLPGGHGALVAPVRVEEVAAMFRTALQREEAIGRTYDLAGPDALAFDDMLRLYRDTVPGAKRIPLIGVPGKFAALQARLFGMIGLGRLLPFDEGMARMAMEESVSECARARADLGFDPQPFTDSLAAYAAQL
jgi:NADH dehydrogenase